MKLLTAFILLLLLGCKKSEKPFQSHLSMTIDGVSVVCDKYITASSSTGLPTEVLSLSGNWTNSTIGAGSFEIEYYDFNNTTGDKQLQNPSLVTLRLVRTLNNITLEETYFGPDNVNRLTVTEVNDKFVKGTFQFGVKMNTGPNTFVTKLISNGAFHIAR